VQPDFLVGNRKGNEKPFSTENETGIELWQYLVPKQILTKFLRQRKSRNPFCILLWRRLDFLLSSHSRKWTRCAHVFESLDHFFTPPSISPHKVDFTCSLCLLLHSTMTHSTMMNPYCDNSCFIFQRQGANSLL
jgi:hypothetical protein